MRDIPHVRSWHERYKDKGLVVIGNHAPEFDFEKSEQNLRSAMERLGVPFPVVMDNDFVNWRAFRNRYWPTKYLIDKRGIVRLKVIGEGGYARIESMIQSLLAE